MHIIINNPDVIEFDLNEALDVFIIRKFILETCIWENGDDNWMKKKKLELFWKLWMLHVCLKCTDIFSYNAKYH